MKTFHYTDYSTPQSSFITGVYYNAQNKSMALNLKDAVYVYENVSQGAFDTFVEQESLGRHYYSDIQPNYGPGQYLGRAEGSVNFTRLINTNTGNSLNTSVVKSNPKRFAMTVVYKVEETEYQYKTSAESIADAVGELKSHLLVVGLEIKIVKVVVYFNE